jgi:hypothetical protein
VLPWRFTQIPSPSGNAKGSVCHLDLMLPEYYALRGWDGTSGVPRDETLARLGIGDASARIRDAIVSSDAARIRANLGWAAPYTDRAVDDL